MIVGKAYVNNSFIKSNFKIASGLIIKLINNCTWTTPMYAIYLVDALYNGQMYARVWSRECRAITKVYNIY